MEGLIIAAGVLLIVYMIYLVLKSSSNPRINLGSIWLKKSPFFFFDVNKKATILYVFIILIIAIASVFFLLSDLVTRMFDFSN
jgi:hypothetical protein